MILGGCYAMGATAPVMFTGAVAYASVPKSLLSPAMSLNGLLEQERGVNVSGRIMLEEADIHSLSMEELRKNVGLVFQTPAPFPFSIYKNLT